MTNEQINIAIAKACGRSNDDIERGYVPDYCNDLNAMREVENYLVRNYGDRKWREYCDRLTFRTTIFYGRRALQRAEAFLKTIGKWKK